jgi:hypothetical protein
VFPHYPFLVILFIFTIYKSSAQPLSASLKMAYHKTLELKLESAQQYISDPYSREQDEAFRLYIQSLSDLLRLTLTRNDSLYALYPDREKEYLNKLDLLETEDQIISFVKGEIKLHAAIIRILYDDPLAGAIRFIQSYKIVQSNLDNRDVPQFFFKTAGVLNILLSIIPDKYDFFLKLIGVRSDLSLGIIQLEKIAETHTLFRFESGMILALLHAYYLNNRGQALSILNNNQDVWKQSLLFYYLKGLISIKSRENETAIEAFSACNRFNRYYFHIPAVSFYLAESYLKKMDLMQAKENYSRYLDQNNQTDLVKAAHFKLSLIFQFLNDSVWSGFHQRKVISEGSLNTEMDIYAYTIVKNNVPINPEIQKARLLFDGGYYRKSLEQLKSIENNNLTEFEKLEFDYRTARVYQLLKDFRNAEKFYQKTFGTAYDDHYLVANAHLQMGYIQYERGNEEQSELHFRKALKYSGDLYRNSIRNEARAGLNLIESNSKK